MGGQPKKRIAPPSVIRVSPFDVRVIEDPNLSSIGGVLGAFGPDDGHILLDANQHDEVARDTLLHECLHAVWNQTHLKKRYSEKAEEEIIWCLAPRILALLRDNPVLLRFLTDGGR